MDVLQFSRLLVIFKRIDNPGFKVWSILDVAM